MAKILLIEDLPHQRALFSDVLREDGYEVATAEGGEAGLAAVESEQPDLIVLDVDMRDIDGIELLGRMVGKASHTRAPVIIHSAYGRFQSECRTWSADAFVVKSSEMSGLREAVREVLARKREDGDASAGTPAST